MSFKIVVGEYAFYPGHGIVRLEKIETKDFYGKKKKFMKLEATRTGLKLSLPIDQADKLRECSTVDECSRAVEIASSKVKMPEGTWGQRYRSYYDKLHSGDILKIAEIIRDLKATARDQKLTMGETKMLDEAFAIFKQELLLVLPRREYDRLGVDRIF